MAYLHNMQALELKNDTTVSNKIGDRLYAGVMPQKRTFPAIQYFRDPGDYTTTHDGTTDPQESSIQYKVWDEQYDRARETAQAVVDVFEDPPDQLGWDPGIKLYLTDIVPPFDQEPPRDDPEFHIVVIDVTFWHGLES